MTTYFGRFGHFRAYLTTFERISVSQRIFEGFEENIAKRVFVALCVGFSSKELLIEDLWAAFTQRRQ